MAYGVDARTADEIGALGLPHVCGHQALWGSRRCECCFPSTNAGAEPWRAGHCVTPDFAGPPHINGELHRLNVCDMRWEGFKSVFTDVEPVIINEGLGIQAGRVAAAKLMPMIRKGKVDSVFVVNDLTALGVMQVLFEKGLRVPDDISVVSYDNLPFHRRPASQADDDPTSISGGCTERPRPS